ncbi:hypothetical protein Spp001_30 [Shewanella phage Spp001]|uniref:HD domain-containing protein n=1 Tax=Shewanella phage Spp001 TaxID=1445859 RepID=W6E883_9CAUD|nr:hypothetical protein Spp001_30 [Shewanella phage Spp001]AHJ10538.1 hypothetical protein Spp001_30 [Shewanella phage Spp001]
MSMITVGFTPAEVAGLKHGDGLYHVKSKSHYTVFCHGRMQVRGLWKDALCYRNGNDHYFTRCYTDFASFIPSEEAASYEAAQRDLEAQQLNETLAANGVPTSLRTPKSADAPNNGTLNYEVKIADLRIGGRPIQLSGMMDATEMIRISRKVAEEQSPASFIPADDVLATLRSGGVERYHAQPDVPAQSTAEHMWGVAILMLKFYGRDLSTKLLAAALTHDCGEVGIGDVPSPTKRASPEVKATFDRLEEEMLIKLGVNWVGTLSEEETIALKICDVLEGLHYVTRKLRVPNMRVAKAWAEYAATLPLNVAQKKFVLACLNNEEVVLIDRSAFATQPQAVK